MYFDIHSHILHNIDDGAKNIDTSLSLLKESARQGISNIILTPHFYPLDVNLEAYTAKAEENFTQLKETLENENLPNIYLGYEVLYYAGIGRAEALKQLTLNRSKYILIEPEYDRFDTSIQRDLFRMCENELIPIIAHIERFYKFRGYKKFLKFVKENNILTQVNATSYFNKKYDEILSILMAEDMVTVVASDAHSTYTRPPLIAPALNKIKKHFGEGYAQKLIQNSQNLLSEIVEKEF